MGKYSIKKLHLKLQTKIMIFMVIVIFISILNTVFYISRWRINEIRKETEISNMNMATIISQSPVIKQNLGDMNKQQLIGDYVNYILKSAPNIEIIVVVDMNNIRYAHPKADRIGKKFVGGDEKRVLEKAESYTSEAVGTLGRQIRAFVPVLNDDGKQVGFVMVSKSIKSFKEDVNSALNMITVSSLLGLIIGIIGVFILSKNIKNSLLGLEPDEIARLYTQRQGMLDAMHEGIIAIDENSKITLINSSAIKMLKLNPDNIIGCDILEGLPSCKLGDVLVSGKAEYYREQIINDTIVVINRVPIKDNGRIAGAIATFSDKTAVHRLAEEITGVRQVVDALRANTHEFMNKLHTILGLIDLGEINEAKKYIMNETEKHQKILNQVMSGIKDPAIAGLLLGKINRARELGIKARIDSESSLSKNAGGIDSSAYITILGNLIENAMDALSVSSSDLKTIDIFIKENSDTIVMKITDNGIGIKAENLDKIFEKGFSTKEGSRGHGLFLVRDTVEALKGSISVKSSFGQGSRFIVELPKGVTV